MKTIKIVDVVGDFAEDKDLAADIRVRQIEPALEKRREIKLDFTRVQLVTQSFIHALICEPLRTQGEEALGLLIFTGCSTGVRGIIETVVQYSLETMDDEVP